MTDYRTITCVGCDATATTPNGVTVGAEQEASGFAFCFLVVGGSCWVCPTCSETVREGVAKLREVFGDKLRELHMLKVFDDFT